jgi:hypothetical protein
MGSATLTATMAFMSLSASAIEYTYQEIAKRNSEHQLNKATMQKMAMEAECLVGIKKLNFKRKDAFDPIAEWSSFRTRSLLEKYTPCESLVILEIAQQRLREEK